MSAASKNPIVEPYLFFNGHCEQAVEFYRKLDDQHGAVIYKASPALTGRTRA